MFENLALVYDKLASDIDYHKWANKMEESILEFGNGGKKLVEMCCGTGAISYIMAQKGYQVVGIDNSEDMLEIASKKAMDKRVDLKFVCQDMRSFELPRKVDYIVTPCDGINYLLEEDELQRFFDLAYEQLKDGGLLIFDFSTSEKLLGRLSDNTFYDISEEVSFFWKNNTQGNLKIMELIFFIQDQDGKYDRFDEQHMQRIWSENEIERALRKFEIIKSERIKLAKLDDRIQYVCKKID